MIIVFDLDGTLCETREGRYMEAVPDREAIRRVNDLYDAGNTIIIDTARGTDTGEKWHPRTYAQLLGWGVRFHQLRTGMKFYADRYIDDKGTNVEDWLNE